MDGESQFLERVQMRRTGCVGDQQDGISFYGRDAEVPLGTIVVSPLFSMAKLCAYICCSAEHTTLQRAAVAAKNSGHCQTGGYILS
jgi:hypothetical protein